MPVTFSEEARDWLRCAIGGSTPHFDFAPMKGATSSSLFLISHPGSAQKFVLRILDNRKWLAEEPDLAAHEAAALIEARQAGLRVPTLLEYSSSDVGFGAPVVLMSFVAGEIQIHPPNFEQWLEELAHQLTEIHRHPADDFPWQFHSWVEKSTLAPPTWTTIPRVWEQAIALLEETPPADRAVFIHRDYHPINVLWQRNKISGVVDWINACRGPAGVDVAHCRINLALMFGPDAADRFLNLGLR